MSLHYYHALSYPGAKSVDSKGRRAEALHNAAYGTLQPFYQFLSTAIQSMRKRSQTAAKWRPVADADLLRIVPSRPLYRVPRTTRIRVSGMPSVYGIQWHDEEPAEWPFEVPIYYRHQQSKHELRVGHANLLPEGRIRIPSLPDDIHSVSWAGDAVTLLREEGGISFKKGDVLHNGPNPPRILEVLPENELLLDGHLDGHEELSIAGLGLDYEVLKTTSKPQVQQVVEESPTHWLVISSQREKFWEEVPVGSHPIPSALFDKRDRQPFQGTRRDGNPWVMQIEQTQDWIGKILVDAQGLEYRIEKVKGDRQEKCWIQLMEKEEDDPDEAPGDSPLRVFFDDEVEISDNLGNKYKVLAAHETEMKLQLALHRNQPQLPEGDTLHAKLNTYQLERQRQAVQSLQDMPLEEHRPLLRLLEGKDHARWANPMDAHPPRIWHVLTDGSRAGADEQRRFVTMALSTPDFAILEGPPGSGKTTVILELVCQLIQAGKRVLLCGSTHVAIDNVLERLVEKELLDKIGLLPVRVGDVGRVGEAVKQFQFEELAASTKVDERLILQAANLVCGTTIGILQHPLIKERRGDRDAPVLPEFDYLIVDECSKTTFHEFLVPALYAKRWVLVGDNRQLSPFSDRGQLVSNLEACEGFGRDHQRACFLLVQAFDFLEKKSGKLPWCLCLPVSDKVLKHLREELQQRLAPMPGGKLMGLCGRETFEVVANDNGQAKFFKAGGLIEAAAMDILFIAEDYPDWPQSLPSNVIVLGEKWLCSRHAHEVNAVMGHSPDLRLGGRNMERTFDVAGLHEAVARSLDKRGWAEEVAWRLEREQQLRLAQQQKTKDLAKRIEVLLPAQGETRKKAERNVNNIAAVALPSILELMLDGFKRRPSQTPSTLSEGFGSEALQHRRLRLSYQQRMHPEISSFPREQFYKGEALIDFPGMERLRAWPLEDNLPRASWIHVPGYAARNINANEADALIHYLCDWLRKASRNAPPGDRAGTPWEVAVLTFYRGQERKLREKLKTALPSDNQYRNDSAFSRFHYRAPSGHEVSIRLHTVDKFQGQEADLVLLSMVQTHRDGFLDSPNRLNVALTRARYALRIFGHHDYFKGRTHSDDLRRLAQHLHLIH